MADLRLALPFNFGLLSDPLSGVMLLVVTGVGFLIHVYSVGYMHDDPSYWRYFSFLNFFIFAMVLLVSANSFLFLLVGWAAVGLASYLLIGFWYQRPAAVAAAKKAFVVNVIGDFGLMLAIFLLYNKFGTLAYNGILFNGSNTTTPAPPAFGINDPMLIAITLLLFLACAAKSAQLPLHVWLPDAMEGPTPVSALDPCRHHGHGRRLSGGARQQPVPIRARQPVGRGGHLARPARSLRPPSAWCRTTSSASWPIRPSASLATCSWPRARATIPPVSSI